MIAIAEMIKISQCALYIGFHVTVGNITAPKTVMAMPVIKATNIEGVFDERRLVVKSRTVTHATAPRADIE